mmetsp:Transcript_18900/g.46390  ORF Transcript_18900/g.46390 Transcript_18900/m.46390 type:complete len:249 (-) Transcript_18900:339-1085(-)
MGSSGRWGSKRSRCGRSPRRGRASTTSSTTGGSSASRTAHPSSTRTAPATTACCATSATRRRSPCSSPPPWQRLCSRRGLATSARPSGCRSAAPTGRSSSCLWSSRRTTGRAWRRASSSLRPWPTGGRGSLWTSRGSRPSPSRRTGRSARSCAAAPSSRMATTCQSSRAPSRSTTTGRRSGSPSRGQFRTRDWAIFRRPRGCLRTSGVPTRPSCSSSRGLARWTSRRNSRRGCNGRCSTTSRRRQPCF